MEYRKGMSVEEYVANNREFLHKLAQSGDSLVKAMALTILIAAGELEETKKENRN